MTPHEFDEIVEFIACRPDTRDVLLAEHTDDGSGRCRTCGSSSSGRPRFPCLIRLAASTALGRVTADVEPVWTPEAASDP